MIGSLSKTTLSLLVASALFVVALPQMLEPDALEGSEWHIRVVDADIGSDGYQLYLALDNNGYPHICYSQDDVLDLKYAKWDGLGFVNETVDSIGQIADGCSIAIDSSGHPHIAYWDATGQSLKYAVWDGTAWSNETVDSSGLVHDESMSIALDRNDYPHISYSYSTGPPSDIKYARWNGTVWNLEFVDTEGSLDSTSLALDSEDHPHIVYYDDTNDRIKYARWDGTAWSFDVVDNSGYFYGPGILALDNSDNPHLAYYNIVNGGLNYTRWNGSAWISVNVDTKKVLYTSISLTLDSQDYPHISYMHMKNMFNWDFRYAVWNGMAWTIEAVESEGRVGAYTSIALDSNDDPHIAYTDDTNHSLKYATKAELQPPPILTYHPDSLDFGTLPSGVTQSRTFEVWNSGEGTLTYSFTENTSWVTSVSPSSGSSTGEHDVVTVTIDTTGLSEGQHFANISVLSNGGNGNIALSVQVLALRSLNLNIDPDTLNLKSRGRWITAYLTTEGASPDEVDAPSLLLNDIVKPDWWDIQDNTTLMVKFSRPAVQAILDVGDSVDIKVTGNWTDGTPFEVHDIIRVIDPER